MSYDPTPEQIAVIEACAAGGNVVVEAAAGAGKTSTLRLASQTMTGRVLYLAYNKAAKVEAAASFPSHVKCLTVHGLAFGSVGRDYSHRLDSGRQTMRETAALLQVSTVDLGGGLILAPVQLTRLAVGMVERWCRSADLEIGEQHLPDAPFLVPPQQLRTWQQDAARLRAAGEHQAAAELRALHTTAERTRRDALAAVLPIAHRAWADLRDLDGRIRFTPDHYLKMFQLSEPRLRYDVVMLDEAQDSNPCRSSLVVGQDHAQRIAIGDGCQQLYAWQGAVDALATWPADVRLYLTQSWRFGEAVADEANKWLSLLGTDMRVRGNPGLPTTVGRLAPGEWPDAVLCRSNAGAIARLISALAAGRKPALVGGTEALVDLAEAADELKSGQPTAHPELFSFTSWADVQAYANEEAGADLKVFVDLVDKHGPRKLIAALRRAVDEDSADLTISTAHKSKGREWNVVEIADDFPEPKDSDAERPVSKADAMLAYVAVTRARARLDRTGLAWVDQILHRAPTPTRAAPPPAPTSPAPQAARPAPAATPVPEGRPMPHTASVPGGKLRTRKPTGAVPWPLVLLEGEEKAGKSWSIAELSASPRVGATFWVDLGEGAGDEYGAIPGARYEIVDHDGTWRDIIAQVREVRAVAQAEHDAGRPPVVLAIDSMTNEWAMLADWADQRARRSDRGKALLAKNPDAEVPVSPNYWNDANARHRKLMTLLMTFPGIVVVTARGKWVAEMDQKGNPVPNSKVYKVEGQKTLAYDASVWVRLTRDKAPLIVGARSVHAGVKPGTDEPRKAPNLTLDWLVFDVLKCDPRQARVRDLRALDATAPDADEAEQQAAPPQPGPAQAEPPQARRAETAAPERRPAPSAPDAPDWDAELRKAHGDVDALRALWDRAGQADPTNTALAEAIRAAVRAAKAAQAAAAEQSAEVEDPPATAQQKQRIAIVCGEHGAADREHRLALVSLLIGDRITTTDVLRSSEAEHVLATIALQAKDGTLADTLQAAIDAYTQQEVTT